MANDDEICDCPMEGETTADVDRCQAERHLPERRGGQGFTVICSRPEGHDGPHAACSVTEHPTEVWGEER